MAQNRGTLIFGEGLFAPLAYFKRKKGYKSMKLVDLSVFKEETLDFKLLNGEIIKTQKPTERMIINLTAFQQIKAEEMTETEYFRAVDKIVLMILNNNTENKTFKKEDIKDLSIEMKTAIMENFFVFSAKITSDPNSPSPQSQA